MIQSIQFILLGSSAAITTYLLQRVGVTAVIASCLVGLLGAALGYLLKSQDVAAVVFIGSFVGMTSVAVGTKTMVLIGGGISGLVYVLCQTIFIGFGGRMGTIAFISLLLSMGLVFLLQFLIRLFQ